MSSHRFVFKYCSSHVPQVSVHDLHIPLLQHFQVLISYHVSDDSPLTST